MRVFDETKTHELKREELDFSKGYLVADRIVTHIEEVKEVKEKGHYETIAEYPNGGKDVRYVIDVPGVEYRPAEDKIEEIDVFIRYPAKDIEINQLRMDLIRFQQALMETDHWALKYAEGYYTESEYIEKKQIRESYRQSIRKIQKRLNELGVN